MMIKSKILILVTVFVIVIFAFLFITYFKNSHYEISDNVTTRNFSIVEYKFPDPTSSPLYPIYDGKRNAIWVGDSKINKSRIWEFRLDSKEFIEHKLNVSTITSAVLDSNQGLWYLDPVSKLIGHYNPDNGSNKLVHIPVNGTLSSMVADPMGNIWISASSSDFFFEYETHNNTFLRFATLTPHASPLGMSIDNSGMIWAAEAIGKIASIDTSKNKMTEYAPSNNNLKIPTATEISPDGSKVYIAEHGEDAIFAFDVKSKSFTRYVLGNDPNALPFGMAFDTYGNLWVAEHTINEVAVFQPSTGSSIQVKIPNDNPLTQWLVSDSRGRIWLAEPQGAALALVNESNH